MHSCYVLFEFYLKIVVAYLRGICLALFFVAAEFFGSPSRFVKKLSMSYLQNASWCILISPIYLCKSCKKNYIDANFWIKLFLFFLS